jgi:hypothetical protein
MKDVFREFYKYSDPEIKKMWDECIFVFDTNVLLDLYRFSMDTSKKYIKILKKLKDKEKIWMPYQVGLEFHKRRIPLISDLKNSYLELKNIFDSSISNAQKKINDKYHEEHPFVDLKKIYKELNDCLKIIDDEIDKNERKHPDWFTKDSILSELNNIFKENIGKEYSEDKLKEIYEKGEIRYSKLIPPGYEDESTKKDEKKYGDLIIWYQIIEKAKEIKKPIIFVTRDKKEDWWWKQSGNTIGPRYELKKEIFDEAKINFHMYDSERFLEYAYKYYNETIDKSILDEIKKIKNLEERNYIFHDHNINHLNNFDNYFYRFFIEQELLNKELQNILKYLNINEEILFRIYRIQDHLLKNIKRLIDLGKNNSMIFENLFLYLERLQRQVIMIFENEKFSNNLNDEVIYIFEKMNNSYIELIKNSNDETILKKFIYKIDLNNSRLKRRFRHL